MSEGEGIIQYRRARFFARLRTDRLYTAAHMWLREVEGGLWRTGFTEFALRMLGDIVEHGFNARSGDAVALGQAVGWIEGFKAVSDIFSPIEGTFEGGNPAIERDITLIDSDPYGEGWLFAVRGRPEAAAMDAPRYARLLDETVDRMKAHEAQCE